MAVKSSRRLCSNVPVYGLSELYMFVPHFVFHFKQKIPYKLCFKIIKLEHVL